jgi:hypothetical protein
VTEAICGKEHIDKWAHPPYWIEKYRLTEGIDEATIKDKSESNYVALFSRNRILGSSFQILSYIVSHHIVEPLEEAFHEINVPLKTIVIEPLFFGLLEQLIRKYCKTVPKIAPWPWKKHYCLTIRHDVDRIPTSDVFERLLEYEAANELQTSWFWLPNRLSKTYIKKLEERGHEIGVHFIRLSQREQEIDSVVSLLSNQKRMYGGFVHGSVEGWRGAISPAKDAELGMLYTEYLSTFRNYPYQLLRLDQAGLVNKVKDNIVCLSPMVGIGKYSRLVDEQEKKVSENQDLVDSNALNMHPLPMVPSLIERILVEFVNNSFHIILISHPDVDYVAMSHLEQLLSEEGRINWTCAQVADWWHKTHCKKNLQIIKTNDEPEWIGFRITSELDINDLELIMPLSSDWPPHAAEITFLEDGTEIPCQYESFDGSLGKDLRIRLDIKSRKPVDLKLKKHLC